MLFSHEILIKALFERENYFHENCKFTFLIFVKIQRIRLVFE